MSDHGSRLAEHVAAVERWEHEVRALVRWDPTAAARRAETATAGPLTGWAVGIKDIFDLAGLPTGCGVDFLSQDPAATSASVVERLESLGAYALAKTVTTAFAYLDPGPTRNPWDRRHTPGGSSMGSAAAVATGMVRAAIGSQTAGSVCRPAAFCGVVGFKPSYGRVPIQGCFPLVPTFDTVGFFTRDVADMHALWAAFDADGGCDARSDRGELIVRVVDDLLCGPIDGEMAAALSGAADLVASTGVAVEPLRLHGDLRAVYENNVTIFEAEAHRSHDELFRRYRDRYPPKLKENLTRAPASNERCEGALRGREQAQRAFAAAIAPGEVVLAPGATGPAPRGLDMTGEPRANVLFTHTRAPVVCLPSGLSSAGLPLGLQVAAPFGGDDLVLTAAARIEAALGFSARPFPPDLPAAVTPQQDP